jgi:hypothetical protein
VDLPEEARLSGAAVHMAFVNSGEELLVAVVRAQGIEVRRVTDNTIVDVIAPELTFYAATAATMGWSPSRPSGPASRTWPTPATRPARRSSRRCTATASPCGTGAARS